MQGHSINTITLKVLFVRLDRKILWLLEMITLSFIHLQTWCKDSGAYHLSLDSITLISIWYLLIWKQLLHKTFLRIIEECNLSKLKNCMQYEDKFEFPYVQIWCNWLLLIYLFFFNAGFWLFAIMCISLEFIFWVVLHLQIFSSPLDTSGGHLTDWLLYWPPTIHKDYMADSHHYQIAHFSSTYNTWSPSQSCIIMRTTTMFSNTSTHCSLLPWLAGGEKMFLVLSLSEWGRAGRGEVRQGLQQGRAGLT